MPVIVTPTRFATKDKAKEEIPGLFEMHLSVEVSYPSKSLRHQLPRKLVQMTIPWTNRSPEPSKETPQQQSVKVSALRASTEDPVVERLDSLSRGAGNCSSVPLLRRDTKPGLAPSALLDKLGFEPAGHAVVTPPPVTKAITIYQNCASNAEASLLPRLSFPSGIPSSSLAVSQDFFNIKETEISNDKGDQGVFLTEGFDEIDEMFSKLATHVKMPFHQVSDRYIRLHSRTHGTNLWNTYSMYFAKNMERELARLPKGEQITGTPTADIRKRCFTLFRQNIRIRTRRFSRHGKRRRNWRTWEARLLNRQQVFDKSKKNLNHMFTALSKAHGFEGAYLLAGRVVNQDGGLGHVFMTPGAEQFFATRCRAGDDEIIGHFKVHIYNMVSLQAVEEVFEAPKTDGVDDEVEVVSDTRDRPTWDGSEEREDHAQVKLRLRGLFVRREEAWSEVVFRQAFPMEADARRLAASELVLVNWPEGVMFPGEEPLNDTEDTGSIFDLFHGIKKAALISSEEPVIIGAAPPHDSNKSRGKRMFCNLKTDRLGPKRMANKAATRVKKSSAIVGEECPWYKAKPCSSRYHFHSTKEEAAFRYEISSDSMSPSASDYKPVEESETKSSNDGIQDLYADSVDTEYEQPSSSRKRKVKATASSRKLKIIAANDSGDEPPPSLTEEARGKQPARPASVAEKLEAKSVFHLPGQ
ncbi:hypothetical protein EV401DRAFT_2116111 [Pisolithus croceorrhizus]|nr:hypothetical protein EV401DRAFT_2116111 [Pisolithus croceorrhizus]